MPISKPYFRVQTAGLPESASMAFDKPCAHAIWAFFAYFSFLNLEFLD